MPPREPTIRISTRSCRAAGYPSTARAGRLADLASYCRCCAVGRALPHEILVIKDGKIVEAGGTERMMAPPSPDGRFNAAVPA